MSSSLGAHGTLADNSGSVLAPLPENIWSSRSSYANSKQALNLCAQEIASRFGRVDNRSLYVYTVVTGGMVNTNLKREFLAHLPSPIKWLLEGLAWIALKSPNQGCQSIIHCAISGNVYGSHLQVPETESNQGSGRLYRDGRPIEWPDSSRSGHLSAVVYEEALSIYRRLEEMLKCRI